jgi:predicted nucleotidyltransferase/predicted transcriptional regulator
MTMQIKGVQIAGLPAVNVRNMLRRVYSVLDVDLVAERCKVSTRQAKEVIQELVDGGYIEFSERSRVLANPYRAGREKPRYRSVDYYKLTEKGGRLAQASAMSKMSRERAEQIVAGLLKRVEEVNAIGDYVYRVPTVIVYGSYVRGEPQLSDVDIAVDLEAKWDSANEHQCREWSKRRTDVASANGRGFANFMDLLFWPKNEVMLHLKVRTRGLSIHEIADFMGMKKDSNFAYKVLLGDAARVAEQISRGSSRLA